MSTDSGTAGATLDWSPDVRHQNLLVELVGALKISADAKSHSAQVDHVSWVETNGTVNVVTQPVLKVVRPTIDVFKLQLHLVNDWSELRAERAQEVLTQLAVPLQYWGTVLDLNPNDHRHTLELVQLALAMAQWVNQPLKHHLACPRPVAYSSGIQPIINAGRFSALPSGHAVEAFLLVRLFQRLSREALDSGMNQQLQRLAARISNNRVVAGVHFPIDATAGRMVGETLAEYLLSRLDITLSQGWMSRAFEGLNIRLDDDVVVKGFNRSEPLGGVGAPAHFALIQPTERKAETPSPLLAQLRDKVASEWK